MYVLDRQALDRGGGPQHVEVVCILCCSPALGSWMCQNNYLKNKMLYVVTYNYTRQQAVTIIIGGKEENKRIIGNEAILF
jgi:hypothetical protein